MNEMLFLQGQQDCKEGKPHQIGKGESYDEGFRVQYAKEAQDEQQ